MERDPMESMEKARSNWHHMDAAERAAKAHDAINYAVIAIEEAYLDGKITAAGRNETLLLLGIACAAVHEAAE